LNHNLIFPFKPKSIEIHLPDPDDEPFLEVTIAGKVEAIATGNKRHFPKKEYGG